MVHITQRQVKIVFLILSYIINITYGGSDQRRLLRYLLTDQRHNALERPVRNDSDTLSVTINLALQQIIEFDGKNEVILISGWIVLMWNDYSLVWNPEDFSNIQTLRIPSSNIWTPDILLYNSADEKFDSTMKVNAVVQHNGDVLYVPPGLFKSICPFDIANFPFVRINLTAESSKGQLDAYIKSAEWDLEDFSTSTYASKYDCCPTLYPYVLFTIRIRRRSLYYFTNIVFPCFLISCMTILGFLLAPDGGEKVTLQITILLSVIMFSLLMSDIMPPSSTAIPIITIYFMCIMLMSSISVVASVIVISLHFRNSKNYTMPIWVRKYICYYLAWLLRMKRPRHDLTWRGIRRRWAYTKEGANNVNNQQRKSSFVSSINKDFEVLSNGIIKISRKSLQIFDKDEKLPSDPLFDNARHPPSRKTSQRSKQQDSSTCDIEMIRLDLRTIINYLAILTRHQQQEEVDDDESQDWKFVAMVIDRLCLIIFTASMAFFTGFTFLSSQNFFKFR